MQPKAIDLFCGCGGLTQGLQRAGFDVVAAVDNDELAVRTFKMNHPQILACLNDIRRVVPRVLREHLGLARGELALLAGCPPCQGFSSLRTLNGRKRVRDPNNDLIFELLRFIDEFVPRSLMIENVPALLDDERMAAFRSEIEKRGYLHKAGIFDAAQFGVPQHRRRTILLAGHQIELEFAQPTKTVKTVRKAIKALARPAESKDVAHRHKVERSETVRNMIKAIPRNGGSRKDLPPKMRLRCHKAFSGFNDVYGRLRWDAPSSTITTGCINPSKGRFLHPSQNRALTLREAALLQGFPRRYKFDLSTGKYPVAKLIGNAFPPTFARAHAVNIRKRLQLVSRQGKSLQALRKSPS